MVDKEKYTDLQVLLILNAPNNAEDRLEFEAEMYAYQNLSLIHISEPTRRTPISYAVFCLKKKKKKLEKKKKKRPRVQVQYVNNEYIKNLQPQTASLM